MREKLRALMTERRRPLAAVLLSGAIAAGVFAAGAPAEETSQAATRLTVAGSEFKLRPARLTATEGIVVIRFVNRGSIVHDLRVAGKRTPRIGAGKTATLRFANLKPGTYRFICTVPEHAAAGMRGVLTVKAAAASETTETTEGH